MNRINNMYHFTFAYFDKIYWTVDLFRDFRVGPKVNIILVFVFLELTDKGQFCYLDKLLVLTIYFL